MEQIFLWRFIAVAIIADIIGGRFRTRTSTATKKETPKVEIKICITFEVVSKCCEVRLTSIGMNVCPKCKERCDILVREVDEQEDLEPAGC